MRVDWCVSSWFRIKNTHSLTHSPFAASPPFPFPLRAVGSSIHLQRGWWYTALSRGSSATPPAPSSAPEYLRKPEAEYNTQLIN